MSMKAGGRIASPRTQNFIVDAVAKRTTLSQNKKMPGHEWRKSNAMDTDTPQPATPKRRRRFQFRLRTLFVVVTLLSIAMALLSTARMYIGRQTKIVAARKKWIEIHPTRAILAEAYPDNSWAMELEQKIPLVRRWLGDKAVTSIDFDDEDRSVKELFPEAYVAVVPRMPNRLLLGPPAIFLDKKPREDSKGPKTFQTPQSDPFSE
jgi:hypothetical protein